MCMKAFPFPKSPTATNLSCLPGSLILSGPKFLLLLIRSWVLLMLLSQGPCPMKYVDAATGSTLFIYVLV